jgi:hypothetical protein
VVNATDRVVEALLGAGMAVGDGEARTAAGPLEGRYCVVRTRPEQRGEGTIADANADRNQEVQVTSVGPSRRAADQIADEARAVVLGPIAPPDGWSWMQAAEFVTSTHASTTAGTTSEANTDPSAPEAPVWFRVDVYRFYLTPA